MPHNRLARLATTALIFTAVSYVFQVGIACATKLSSGQSVGLDLFSIDPLDWQDIRGTAPILAMRLAASHDASCGARIYDADRSEGAPDRARMADAGPYDCACHGRISHRREHPVRGARQYAAIPQPLERNSPGTLREARHRHA